VGAVIHSTIAPLPKPIAAAPWGSSRCRATKASANASTGRHISRIVIRTTRTQPVNRSGQERVSRLRRRLRRSLHPTIGLAFWRRPTRRGPMLPREGGLTAEPKIVVPVARSRRRSGRQPTRFKRRASRISWTTAGWRLVEKVVLRGMRADCQLAAGTAATTGNFA
jgi:hypothetical protein